MFIYIMEELDNTIKLVKQIRIDMKLGLDRTALYNKYNDFAVNKPKTFFNTLDGSIDEAILLEIRNKYCEVHEKSETNKSEKATSALGEHLAEKYLYPTFGVPTEDERKQGQREINKILKETQNGLKE